ncbi:LPXTG cell wall anchor domain-containing protein [Lentzea sp. JNUCC 0626]|uniref:LPXTG cell wall anchor domain-containing protein n=1 Tax=Lentzea sp. JNUCC 0626 TaxID=3367513 RepID=UPI003747B81E
MRLTPLRRSGLLASAALAAVASLVLATSAFADEATTDDPRAQAFLKFVDVNHPEACTVGGLTGSVVLPDGFTYSGGDNTKYLNITALPADVKVTGMVVRSGDLLNVYLVDKLGDVPWNELRAPVLNGGELPEIGQWFGCGIKEEEPPTSSSSSPTSTTTTTTTTTTESSSSSTTTTTSETSVPSSSSEETAATTTTTTVAPVPVAEVDDLAATGFGSTWLVGFGAALVAAGAALVLVMRRRRA